MTHGDSEGSGDAGTGDSGDGDDDGGAAVRRRARAFASSFLPALALFLWVRTYVVEPFYIPSVSMYPTLTVNDQIAVEKFSKFTGSGPRRGDLVVFRPPLAYYEQKHSVTPSTPLQRVSLIKRVVAVAGDHIEVRDGVLFRNGQLAYEPYVREPSRYTLPPTTVPAGCVFVLGDNRNVSDDSHVWGALLEKNVVGKAFYIIWPIARQGFVDEFMQDLVRAHTAPCARRAQRRPPWPTMALALVGSALLHGRGPQCSMAMALAGSALLAARSPAPSTPAPSDSRAA